MSSWSRIKKKKCNGGNYKKQEHTDNATIVIRPKGVKAKKCQVGKKYNPETKRCKNKCPTGKEYNLNTKRCRKKVLRILVESSYSSKHPKAPRLPDINCPYGQLLLPDASRCESAQYIGSGTYGCVITPPVSESKYIIKEDVKYIDRANDDISKIFKSKLRYYEYELDILKRIQQIDPTNTFTTKLKAAHYISADALQGSSTLQKCLEKSDVYYQIILENGGKTINSNYTITFKKFLSLFKTFLAGMITLQNNKIVHRDIKPINVLITSKKINLIDWGLYCYAEDLFKSKYKHVLAYDYEYYPPEFYIAYVLLHKHQLFDGNRELLHNYLDNMIAKMQLNGYFNQSFFTQSLLNTYYSGINDFIATVKQRGYKTYAEIFTEELAYKTDVFGIAYILKYLAKNIQYTNQAQKNFVNELYLKCINCNPYKRISFQELYSIISAAEAYSNSQQSAGKNKKT